MIPDVTDAQKQAAAKFIQASYPNTPVYRARPGQPWPQRGHGGLGGG